MFVLRDKIYNTPKLTIILVPSAGLSWAAHLVPRPLALTCLLNLLFPNPKIIIVCFLRFLLLVFLVPALLQLFAFYLTPLYFWKVKLRRARQWQDIWWIWWGWVRPSHLRMVQQSWQFWRQGWLYWLPRPFSKMGRVSRPGKPPSKQKWNRLGWNSSKRVSSMECIY